MLTGKRVLKPVIAILVLLIVMPSSAQAGRRGRVWRTARLAYSTNRILATQYLRFNPFAVDAGRPIRQTDSLLRPVAAQPDETTALAASGDAPGAAATGAISMLGVRPPIRVPYRPPLRSPYRPPVPW